MQLKTTTSQIVMQALRTIFSRHGILQILISNNGPQYCSKEFTMFAFKYRFTHITSNPCYPQSNSLAKRTVKSMKGLPKESGDYHLALLCYRAKPLPWCNLSPAELLMGRKLRTDVPTTTASLTPQWGGISQHSERRIKRRRGNRNTTSIIDTALDHCQTSPMTLTYGSRQEEIPYLVRQLAIPPLHDRTLFPNG